MGDHTVPTSADRRYDFDWLRVLGAVLVVVAHCSGLFSAWAPTFGDIQKSKLFSELLWNLNLWLMPLFMLLAGASVWYTLRKRTNGEYLRERTLHLGLPLVILTLTFGIPMAYWSQSSTGQFSGSLSEFYLRFFDIFPAGTFHLWFLAYLFIYALLTLPLFRFLQTACGRMLIGRLGSACQHTGGLYLFALPLLVVQLALSGLSPLAPLAAPPNELAHFVLLLLAFVFGYILISDAHFQQAIARQWLLHLAVALAASALMFAFAWPDNFDISYVPIDYSWPYVAFWTLFAIGCWSMLLAWLGVGQRFLNVNSRILSLAAPLSYPLYLLHPLVLAPATLLVARWQAPALLAFLVETSGVLIGTFALTALLKRWRIARYVLGLKVETPRTRLFIPTMGNSTVGLYRAPFLNVPFK
jgi:glucan biosynthesis protein C